MPCANARCHLAPPVRLHEHSGFHRLWLDCWTVKWLRWCDRCSAKERILAHAREQELDVPVTVTERGSVAVEDVATMLDRVLINSSNNADSLADAREAARIAEADAACLRAEVAKHTAQAAVDAEHWLGELGSVRQQLEGVAAVERHATAEVATLREQLSTVEMRFAAAEAEAAAARAEASEELQGLRATAADAEARVVQLEMAGRAECMAAEEAREVAQGEVVRLSSRLVAAEEALGEHRESARVALDAAVQERDDAAAESNRIQAALEVVEQERVATAAELDRVQAASEVAEQERVATAVELNTVRNALEVAEKERSDTAAKLNAVNVALVDSERMRAELESKHRGSEEQRMEVASAAEAANAVVRLELDESRAALQSERSSNEVLRSALIALQERMAASSESSHTGMAQLQQDLAAARADVDGLRVEAATRALEAAAAAEAAAVAEGTHKAQQEELAQLREVAARAQEREEDLLQQIQELEESVHNLSAAMVEFQQQVWDVCMSGCCVQSIQPMHRVRLQS